MRLLTVMVEGKTTSLRRSKFKRVTDTRRTTERHDVKVAVDVDGVDVWRLMVSVPGGPSTG